MTNSTRISTSTWDYEWAHSRKPRGRGHWMFEISITTPGFGSFNTTRHEWGTTALYSEAKREAIKVACRLATNAGVDEARINVLS